MSQDTANKKELEEVTYWCQYCDTTLWSTKDNGKIAETEQFKRLK